MYVATILALCWTLGMLPSLGPVQSSDSPKTAPSQNAPPLPGAPSPTSVPKKPTAVSHKMAVSQKKRRHRKSAPAKAKVVVPNGGTADPSVQFSTSASPEQASKEREKTAGLLVTTNSNLQKLSGQTLNPTQEDTVKQIHSYLQQAKTAEAAGDLQSAHNLALKAQLLSNDLVQK